MGDLREGGGGPENFLHQKGGGGEPEMLLEH